MKYKEIIIQLLEKYEIPYWETGKNVIDGRTINIQCPFCGDHSNHLGIFGNTLLYRCWKCPAEGDFGYLLSILTRRSKSSCWEEIQNYGITFEIDSEDQILKILEEKEEIFIPNYEVKEIKLPSQFQLVQEVNSNLLNSYLSRRKLSINTLIEHDCGICQAGEYMNRLIIPVYFQNKLVAFQAADMTGKSDLKYKADTKDSAIKNYFYRWDKINKNCDWLVVVEGVLDAWRLGAQTVAAFGLSFSSFQEKVLMKLGLKKLIFCTDGDAYLETLEFAEEYKPFIPEVHVIELPYCWENFDTKINEDPDSYGAEKTWNLIKEECFT